MDKETLMDVLPWFVVGAVIVITFIVEWFSRVAAIKRRYQVPGLNRESIKEGNLPRMVAAGSVHAFLEQLHAQFGPVASFWWGPRYCVSVCEQGAFEQYIFGVEHKPADIYQPLEHVFGSDCVFFTPESDVVARRNIYNISFYNQTSLERHFRCFQRVADEMLETLKHVTEDDHVATSDVMSSYAMKAVLYSLCGDTTLPDSDIRFLQQTSASICSLIEEMLLKPTSEERSALIRTEQEKIRDLLGDVVSDRKDHSPEADDKLFIDHVIDGEVPLSDLITYLLLGCYKTSNLLSWAVYYLCRHTDVQSKLHEEIQTILGDEHMTLASIPRLEYMQQVLNETMRRSALVPWTARVKAGPCLLGGYKVPGQTPVILALGIAGRNPEVFCEPEKFDPDRFSIENTQLQKPLSFVPFGFPGNRKCPADLFSFAHASVALVTILRNFRIKMVTEQDVKPMHGFVTIPSEEIWLTLLKR
ncbi:cytochrome P450 20A1-like [Dreissena polymorpha]|nr:cytochrome P450 20A1-like [Dreissena polymorpha]